MGNWKAIFRTKPSQNWLRAQIGLRYVCKALHNLRRTGLEQIQDDIFNKLYLYCGVEQRRACSKCKTENAVACDRKNGICSAGRTCKFHNDVDKQPRICPMKVCNAFAGEITNFHRYNRPSWKNTDARGWCDNPWQIGKCFLSSEGYAEVMTLNDCDYNGRLNILINCTPFEQKFSFNVADKSNTLEKARVIGRHLRHSSDLAVTDEDLAYFMDTWKAILEDPVYMATDVASLNALKSLNEILFDDQQMPAEDIHLALKTAFRQDLIQLYKRDHTHISVFPLAQKRQAKLDDIFELPTLTEKCRHANTVKKIESFKDLFKLPSNNNKDIYITGQSGMGKTSLCKRIAKQWCDAFAESDHILTTCTDETGPVESVDSLETRRMPFCTWLTSFWWTSQKPENSEKQEFKTRLDTFCQFNDSHTLLEFPFLFIVELRDATSMCDMDDMIEKQIIPELSSSLNYDRGFLERVMTEEKCLVILDGLDEWEHPPCQRKATPVPHRKARDKCVIVTTVSPWKFVDVNLNESSVSSQYEIAGLESTACLKVVENVMRFMNEAEDDITDANSSFKHVLNEYPDIVHIPIVLMQLLALWMDMKPIGRSYCQLYTHVIDMLIERGVKRASAAFSESPGEIAERSKAIETEFAKLKKYFDDSTYVKEHWSLMCSLTELAYNCLFPENDDADGAISLLLDQSLVRTSLTPGQRRFAMRTGILSESKVDSCSKDQTVVSFHHQTYRDYFAGLHLVREKSAMNNICSLLCRHSGTKRFASTLRKVAALLPIVTGMNVESSEMLRHAMVSNSLQLISCLPVDDFMSLGNMYHSHFSVVYESLKMANKERVDELIDVGQANRYEFIHLDMNSTNDDFGHMTIGKDGTKAIYINNADDSLIARINQTDIEVSGNCWNLSPMSALEFFAMDNHGWEKNISLEMPTRMRTVTLRSVHKVVLSEHCSTVSLSHVNKVVFPKDASSIQFLSMCEVNHISRNTDSANSSSSKEWDIKAISLFRNLQVCRLSHLSDPGLLNSLVAATRLKELAIEHVSSPNEIDLAKCVYLKVLNLDNVDVPGIDFTTKALEELSIKHLSSGLVLDILDNLSCNPGTVSALTVKFIADDQVDQEEAVMDTLNDALGHMKNLSTLELSCLLNMSLLKVPESVKNVAFENCSGKMTELPRGVHRVYITETCLKHWSPSLPRSLREINLLNVELSIGTLKQLINGILGLVGPCECNVMTKHNITEQRLNDWIQNIGPKQNLHVHCVWQPRTLNLQVVKYFYRGHVSKEFYV